MHAAKAGKVDLNRKEDFNDLAADLGFDEDQTVLLNMRHQMSKKLGANEQFLGNGMTTVYFRFSKSLQRSILEKQKIRKRCFNS